MWVFLQVLFLIGFALLLVKSTFLLMGVLKHIAQVTKLGKFGVTAFILAFATSLPELVVGIVASVEGDPVIPLGNILGSNIANLSLVIGGAALVGGGIRVVGEFLRRDLFLSFLAGSLPLLMLVDAKLTRFDGVVLLVVYVVYMVTVLREKEAMLGKKGIKESAFRRLFYLFHKKDLDRDLGKFLIGVLGLLISSHMVVQLSEAVATGFGIPLVLVGLFLVAMGTSLPELVFELEAVKKREVGMVFGDLLGSIVSNSTLIMGLVAVMRPFSLNGGLRPYLLGTMGFVLIFLVFWFFASTKKRLESWEGVVLLLMYLLFALVEFVKI